MMHVIPTYTDTYVSVYERDTHIKRICTVFMVFHQWTLDLSNPLMSPEELDELMDGT